MDAVSTFTRSQALISGIAIIGIIVIAGLEEANAKAAFQVGSNGKTVSASGLSPTSDCVSAKSNGVIGKVQYEDGVARGMEFKEKKESIYINIPALYNFPSEVEKQKAIKAYKDLIQEGRSASIVAKICGAAGRIKKLDAIR